MEKVKLLHDNLSGTGGASTSMVGTSGNSNPFTASRRWLHRFKAQYNLRNIKLIGECASADHDAAKAFPAELASLIEKGYLPEQVFNADETGFFWKKMPTRTFISAREQRSRLQARKGPGIPSALHKRRRGLHGKAHMI